MTPTETRTRADALRQMVQALADARNLEADLAEIVAASRVRWETENAAAIERLRVAREAVTTMERDLKSIAVAEWRETGTKHPAPGVGIRVSERPVYDADRALQWAQETRMALTPEALDVAAFTKIAKATALPFVRMEQTATATLASDLAAALEDDDA